MDLRRLRTFVTVAEQGSVSKAALRLHISQPGLSRQIHDLQQELGLQLFDRVGRRLVLTAEGEQLLGRCRNLLRDASSLSEEAQLLRRGDTGVLRVAASPIQIETVLSTFLPRYAECYPDVQVKLIEAVGTTLAMIERGEVHIGVGLIDTVAVDNLEFGIYPLPARELLAVAHQSFPLERGNLIDIRKIVSHPLLLADPSFAFRKTFDAVCRLARLNPNILVESRAPHTLLALAEAGLGVAIISSSVRSDRYTLRTARIAYERKPIRLPLAIVWDKRRMLPRYAQDFCDLLAVHVRKPPRL